jgi:hypothetical protein
MNLFRRFCLFLAAAAMLYAAGTDPITVTEPRPINQDQQIDLLRKTAWALSGRTYSVVKGSGAATITAGKLKWSVTAVGGTVTVNIGGAGAQTIVSGYTLSPDALPGWTSSQAVVIAEGTGTAQWSYVSPD